MQRSTHRGIALGALALALLGCAPGVEGDWESKEKIAGSSRRSTMELTADGEGEADIHVVVTDAQGQAFAQKFVYEIEWDEKDNGDFELEMSCRGDNCVDELDFLQDCELSDDEELECDGDNAFQGLELIWERD